MWQTNIVICVAYQCESTYNEHTVSDDIFVNVIDVEADVLSNMNNNRGFTDDVCDLCDRPTLWSV